ncbi:MAG: EamA family transporter, partial [Clostridia bacterium]|nr:EamA family transporter [Clostridia bacterium]
LLGMVAFNAVNVVRHLTMGSILTYFEPYFDLENMIGFLFLGVVSAVFATCLNSFALSKIKPSGMSAFGGISMLTTIAIGVIFNNEKLYLYHIIGLLLILVRMIGVSVIGICKDCGKSLDKQK